MAEGKEDIKKHLEMLSSDETDDRRSALLQLGNSRDESVLSAIAECLKDPSRGVQQTAADILMKIGGREAVLQTLPFLHHELSSVRGLAVEVLESIGGDAVDLIVSKTKDSDSDVRKFAIDILGTIKARTAFDRLAELLKDENPNVRAASAEALGKIGDARAVNMLVPLLGDDEWVRFSTIEALSLIGDKSVVPALIKAMDCEGAVQLGAIEALGNIGDDAAVMPLLGLVKKGDKKVRSLAVAALMEITQGNEGIVAEKVGKDAFLNYLTEALSNDSRDIRMSALRGMGALGEASSIPAVLLFAKEILPEDEEALYLVTEVLENIKSPEEMASSMEGLGFFEAVDNDDEKAGSELILLLGRIGNEKTVDFLRKKVVEVDKKVRVFVLRAIGFLASDSCIDEVTDSLKDRDGNVRKAAAYALGEMRSICSVEPLLKSIECEKFLDVKEEIAHSISKIGGEKGIEALKTMLSSNDPLLRELAVRHVGITGSDEVFTLLESALKDSEWSVRKSALNAISHSSLKVDLERILPLLDDENDQVRSAVTLILARSADERAIAPLVRAMSDSSMMVRFRSAEALGAIGGRKVYDILIDILDNDSTLEKIGAIKALEVMRDRRAIESITRFLEDEDEILRDIAREALSVLESVEC